MASTQVKKIYYFGTSGYRNDQDSEFNEAVIRQITLGISDYLISEIQRRGKMLPILLGGDTREKTRRFSPYIAELLVERGLDVFQANSDVPSPVLAYAAKYFDKLNLGYSETLGAILMTASHNPWPYGGYNFLTPDAAVMPTPVSKQFEQYQGEPLNLKLDRTALDLTEPAKVTYFDPYPIYRDHLKQTIGIQYNTIRESTLTLYYDALYATGRQYFPRLLKEEGIEVQMIHGTDELPTNYEGMPEPTGSNLSELSQLVKADPNFLKLGLANDGDSDRFGVLNEAGDYLNPNQVLALILYHLLNNRNQRGVVVRSQATTHLLDALAAKYDLPVIQTPVGYKYIAEEIIEHEESPDKLPVIIGGESSGGISVLHHIPEKDGILANLLIAELVGVEKQPLSTLLETLQASLPLRYVFRELGVKTENGKQILSAFQQRQAQGGKLGEYFEIDTERSTEAVQTLEQKFGTRDGAKLYLKDGSWLLLRASGTEPIARVYVEGIASTQQEAQQKSQQLLDIIQTMLIDEFQVPSNNIKEKK